MVLLVTPLVWGFLVGFGVGWAFFVGIAWGMCRLAARADEQMRREPWIPTAERLQDDGA